MESNGKVRERWRIGHGRGVPRQKEVAAIRKGGEEKGAGRRMEIGKVREVEGLR